MAANDSQHRPDRTWTILELLQWATDFFKDKGLDSPRLDAEILIGHSLGLQRVQLYTQFDRPLQAPELAAFKKLLLRRARDREPVAYIVGERGFWSLSLEVSPAVLVPRPETERLVELTLERLHELDEPTLVDVGTGSGAIALALATELPGATVYATDLSPDALAVAARNAAAHELDQRVRFVECDLLGGLDRKLEGHLDAIVSNPPYVTAAEYGELAPELAHEPRMALVGPDDDGLGIVRRLARLASTWLAPGGWFLCEIGAGQGEPAQHVLATAGLTEVSCEPDYAGLDRVVVGRRPS